MAQDKVVVITGASSGIGEATAKRLAGEGKRVVLGARREGRLQRLAAEIEAAGGEAVYEPCDVTKIEDVERLAQKALDTYGRHNGVGARLRPHLHTWHGICAAQHGLNMFINAQGFPKVGMLTTIIGCAINVVMDPVFIFGLNMGAGGAALSTVISEAASAIWVLHFLSVKKAVVRLKSEDMKLEASIMKPVLALGVSSFVMLTTESVLSMTFNKSLAFYGGDLAVGAMSMRHAMA